MGNRLRKTDYAYATAHALEQGYYSTNRLETGLLDRLNRQKKDWHEGNGFNIGFTLTFKGARFENGDMLNSRGKLFATETVKRFWNELDKKMFGKANVEKRNKRFKRIGYRQIGNDKRNVHWHFSVNTQELDEMKFITMATWIWENKLMAGYIEWNKDIGKEQDAWTQYSSRQVTTLSSDTLCTHTTHL